MRKSVSNEFFYYNAKPGLHHSDFTDDSVLTNEQRIDFLTHYASYLEKCYELPKRPEKVVEDKEVAEALRYLQNDMDEPRLSGHLDFPVMQAYLQKKQPEFEGWSFYTGKVEVEQDSLIFRDEKLPPVPAAVYTFPNASRVEEFEFSFVMSSDYAAEIPGGILDTTHGRTVEFRSGINDILKLQFYSDGTCYARLGNKCAYHLENIYLGRFCFDKPQNVRVLLGNEDFKVVLNGTESELLPLTGLQNPDMVFIGCGMFHRGTWHFTPRILRSRGNVITDFFRQCSENCVPAEPLGEVSLPFSVGTYANRDKAIILEQTFDVVQKERAFLVLESLDPGGSVWINGEAVAETDSFERMRIDISDYLKKGKNHIRIKVNPRAPEVLFNWHRQKDPYNGWFCDRVWIEYFHEVCIDKLTVLPESVSGKDVRFSVSAELSGDCQVNLYMRKTYPVAEKGETCLGSYHAVQGRFLERLEVPADAWSPETPNLYAIRAVACDEKGREADDAVVETGFRIITQKNGDILLNGEKIILTGALTMQFLPPAEETPVTHICAGTSQIVWQELMVKHMNGNTLRMHILGYGSNDARFARIADRLGIMLIWTTRYIDSVEQISSSRDWAARDGYIRQVSQRLNHPSIIMWEGANEYHPTLSDIDGIYNSFVSAVKQVDPTRLICPVSHLYYAGDMIPKPGCSFYNDSGTKDYAGNAVVSTDSWKNPQVIRSAHTYEILLGYGTGWDKMRKQAWSMQKELAESKEHAYIVSEFAVIGRQNPDTSEAKKYFNEYSYEFPDEKVLGFSFKKEEWRLSQAYQALAAKVDVQIMRLNGIDGMLWCCLMGGANDGGYLKPTIDCYGYPKLAFYTLSEGYQNLYAATDSVDVVKGSGFVIQPILYGTRSGEQYTLKAVITEENGKTVAQRVYEAQKGEEGHVRLSAWSPDLPAKGYYGLRFEVETEVNQ